MSISNFIVKDFRIFLDFTPKKGRREKPECVQFNNFIRALNSSVTTYRITFCKILINDSYMSDAHFCHILGSLVLDHTKFVPGNIEHHIFVVKLKNMTNSSVKYTSDDIIEECDKHLGDDKGILGFVGVFPLITLQPGESLDFRFKVGSGTGRDHSHWSPTGAICHTKEGDVYKMVINHVGMYGFEDKENSRWVGRALKLSLNPSTEKDSDNIFFKHVA